MTATRSTQSNRTLSDVPRAGSHWAPQYIGLPWAHGANGPHAWNCWNFVRRVQLAHFGRDLPQVTVDEDNPTGFLRQLRRNPERRNWCMVAVPQDGDVVEMGTGMEATHVGVWAEADGGGVLHCVRGAGVVFSNRFTVRVDWPLMLFWRRRAG